MAGRLEQQSASSLTQDRGGGKSKSKTGPCSHVAMSSKTDFSYTFFWDEKIQGPFILSKALGVFIRVPGF